MATHHASTSQDIRRIRSAGDLPRRPDPIHVPQDSRTSTFGSATLAMDSVDVGEGTSNGLRRGGQQNPHTPRPNAVPIPHPPPQQYNQQTGPLYRKVMAYVGVGRTASPLRKSQASLIWNLFWGFSQVVTISTVLGLSGTRFMSPTDLTLTEWAACDRPLGIWACLWLGRVFMASILAYWEYTRDRQSIRNRAEAAATVPPSSARNTPFSATSAGGQPDLEMLHDLGTGGETPPDPNPLPHTQLYSRLTLLSSLITLSWFLTAHILEYTSLNTCRHSSPHLWWLTFGILCIMYIMVLEVLVLGFVVLIVAPIIFVFWNILLICIGRHPVQNPGMIRPAIGKLPKSVVEHIPLVVYIPAPSESTAEKSTSMPAVPEPIHSYPPKSPTVPENVGRKRFKFLRRISRITKKEGKDKDGEGGTEKDGDNTTDEGDSWEANWERGEYPFVVLEENRAACAICLMEFEEPKRRKTIVEVRPEGARADGGEGGENIREEQRAGEIRLENAGEGAQPLRLLECGHVFHKTCLDPWLTDVSGRCPVCQQAVSIPVHRRR